jgi:hypothetical protein
MFTTAFRRLAGEIIPILVFSCAALVSLLAVKDVATPRWQALRALSHEVSRYKALASDKNRLREVTAQLLDKKKRLETQCAQTSPPKELKDALSPADLSGVLQLLIQLAKDADIRFVKMQPLEGTNKGGAERREYPVILEMTTSYESLGRYVSSLEELPGRFSVGRLAVTVQKNGLDVRILVTCFLAKAG